MKFENNLGISSRSCEARTYIWCRSLLALFLIFATALAVIPEAGQAQEYQFTSIQVEGNQRIQTSTIIDYTGFERGKTVTAAQLNDAYQHILDSGVFETVELTPRGNTLVIEVSEYPTINIINFEGNKRIKDENLSNLIVSASRRVFSPAQAEKDAALLADAYSAQGRVSAVVTPRIIRRSDNRVDLVFEISEGDTIEVERISFVGNTVYSDRRLRRVLDTKQAGIFRRFIRADTLIEDRIEFDKQVLRDFYLSRGYVDFRTTSTNAELTRERDAFYLVVNVQEGQQFKFGSISTVSEISAANAAEFQDSIKIKPGVVYSPVLVEATITRLERLAIRKGIDFLRVEPRITRNDRDLTLDVEFVLSKGPRVFVERIDIEGNTTTLDRVIRQKFRIAEGDPFNPREIRESAERIRALGFFADADVQAREGSSPDQVVVDVDVVEQPTGSLSLGGTYSADSGFGIAIGLTEENFLGRGQRLGFNLQTAQESREFRLSFAEPHILGRELRLDLDIGYARSDSSFTQYDTKVAFFQPGLTFPVSDNGNVQVRLFAINSEMLSRSDSDAGAVIQNEIAAGALQSNGVGFTYTYDSRLTGLNPNAGFLFQAGTDVAGLGGDNKYVKSTAKLVAQSRVLSEEVILRATFEVGSLNWRSDTSSRALDRFRLSTQTMRGFEPDGIGPRDVTGDADDALGGNFYAVARFEAEFPLGLPEELGIRGGVFYDVGNLWNLNDVDTTGATIVGANGSLRHVVGLSFLWDTVIGPLQFNFTKALKKESFDKEQNFDLTLSTKF
ncbi:MAG: outer membrane protein assembly factor BamA [Rhodobacteraceae bacterium]|nr:outer membrane protein assembly factor BamA [Paracoccaceae bacterium]